MPVNHARRGITVVAMGALMTFIGATAVHAEGKNQIIDQRPAVKASVIRTAQNSAAARTLWAKCAAHPEAPHWSKRGKRVIFKSRVTCKGTITHVHVQVRGQLIEVHGSKGKVVAVSRETKSMAVNSKPKTYYTPVPRGRKITKEATYKGRVSVQITSPVRGTKSWISSKKNDVKVPGH